VPPSWSGYGQSPSNQALPMPEQDCLQWAKPNRSKVQWPVYLGPQNRA